MLRFVPNSSIYEIVKNTAILNCFQIFHAKYLLQSPKLTLIQSSVILFLLYKVYIYLNEVCLMFLTSRVPCLYGAIFSKMKDDLRKLCVVWLLYTMVVMNHMKKIFCYPINFVSTVGTYLEGFHCNHKIKSYCKQALFAIFFG